MSGINNQLRKTPVAIVGLASTFAQSRNLEEFWSKIINKKNCITEVPETRWLIEDYYDANPMTPDKTYCKVGGFMPEIDFNPIEFGLPPNILEVTDASQLVSLVIARDALKDAGYHKKSPKMTRQVKDRTGVILGVGGGQKLIIPLTARLQYPVWSKVLQNAGVSEGETEKIIEKIKSAYVGWNENSFPGLLGNVIAGRITNRFDLGGINSVVDAACAASLSAIKMAVSELIEGRADMMLTGGVDTDNSIFMYMSFSKTPAFSKSGNIRPFDDQADGMLIGEGVGMLVLKRLEDAERDGDRIYAVIKGVGGSSDGRFKSVYAPRSSGQALAMERAYQEAGYSPNTLGLIEAHGTGTGAGDPTEFNSMKMLLAKENNNGKGQHIGLGSVKSQVGHTKAAAGAAGMIKAALALHHKILPATINVTQPNSKFGIEETPIYINTETRPWIRPDYPRRAGVSAFGFGGVNVHFALEEYQPEHANAYRLHSQNQAIILHASTPNELLQKCQETYNKLSTSEEFADTQGVRRHSSDTINYFNQLVTNSKAEIPSNAARLGFVCTSIEEASQLLATAIQQLQQKPSATDWQHPKGIYYRSSSLPQNTKVVALFSGQGSQYVNMGIEAACNFPEIRQAFADMDALFSQKGEMALSRKVYPVPVFNEEDKKALQSKLTQTENAQPAIGTLSFGLYKLLQKTGFKADMTAGHSFGELTALWAAGVLSDHNYFNLAKARGAAMSAQNPNQDTGTMLAVKGNVEAISQRVQSLQGVEVANINSTNQVVLGGGTNDIAKAQQILKQEGYRVIPLPVSAAFHTAYVGHAQQPFAEAIHSVNFQTAKVPVYSNTTANPYPSNSNIAKNILQQHILKPVNFKQQIENMYAAGGRIFVEFGPKGVLTNLVKNILRGKDVHAVALNPSNKKDSDLQLRQAIVELSVLGLNLQNFDQYELPKEKQVASHKFGVKISGCNYLSPAFRKKQTQIQNDGFKLQNGGVREVEVIKEVVVEKPVEVIVEKEIIKEVKVPVEMHFNGNGNNNGNGHYSNTNSNFNSSTENESTEDMTSFQKEMLENLQKAMAQFQNQQNQSLQFVQQFTQEQAKTSQAFIELMNRQVSLLEESGARGQESVSQNGRLEARSKKQEVGNENEGSENFGNGSQPCQQLSGGEQELGFRRNTALDVENTATSTLTQENPNTQTLEHTNTLNPEYTNTILEVVAEKTGYPSEMLELEMDMEADLGIDSIKRVEIFGAVQEAHPNIEGIEPNELAELRTLQEVVDYIAAKAGGQVSGVRNEVSVSKTPIQENVNTQTPEHAQTLDPQYTNTILEVVAEKTGYPSEMLELEMDMEADLGIDSIKRVEIFGAVQEAHPNIEGIEPNELAELRTLQEVVDYIAAKAGGQVSGVRNEVSVSNTPIQENSNTQTPEYTQTLDPQYTNTILEVVAEKTGYPSEMLELEMDMEADLGIDSIKRVEIFGAVQEAHPNIEGIEPNELAELRTLQEVVDYIAAKAGSQVSGVRNEESVSNTPIQENSNTQTPEHTQTLDPQYTNTILEVVAEKTGYPTEMLELEMDMEADLGIDSIKRVEIFGAVQEAQPNIEGIEPNELAELRTLQEVVDYIAAKAGSLQPLPKSATVGKVSVEAQENSNTQTPEYTQTLDPQYTNTILEVVAEKTGYPTEMLELEMDMEADLGIDSIKRVEIFGAVQEAHPNIEGIEPNELAELRTLQEVVDYIAAKASGQVSGVRGEESVSTTPIQENVNTQTPEHVNTLNPEYTNTILEVVAEKTGYPTEMLELEMDMEADLGIDSIKRVEIFGAVQEAHPNIEGIEPNELAELRTLQEVVDYIAEKAGGVAVKKKVMA